MKILLLLLLVLLLISLSQQKDTPTIKRDTCSIVESCRFCTKLEVEEYPAQCEDTYSYIQVLHCGELQSYTVVKENCIPDILITPYSFGIYLIFQISVGVVLIGTVAIYWLRRKQIFQQQQERYQRLVASKKKATTPTGIITEIPVSSSSLTQLRTSEPESPVTPMSMNLLANKSTNGTTTNTSNNV